MCRSFSHPYPSSKSLSIFKQLTNIFYINFWQAGPDFFRDGYRLVLFPDILNVFVLFNAFVTRWTKQLHSNASAVKL